MFVPALAHYTIDTVASCACEISLAGIYIFERQREMSSKKVRVKIYVDGQYLAEGLEHIGVMRDNKLHSTVKQSWYLKWLIYCLYLFVIPLLLIWAFILRSDKLMISVDVTLFIVIVVINLFFLQYSILNEMWFSLKKYKPYFVDIEIKGSHYGYLSEKTLSAENITSDDIVFVIIHHIKGNLDICSLTYVGHLVCLINYSNGLLNGATTLLAFGLWCMSYYMLASVIRGVADLVLFKSLFNL
ncbi:hypothetical protein LNP18_06015 [Leuconostoc citreum]|uniref:hypothetical protein n=1 Tax=Leuconostoc citreum TaxID=33964 RepID=UPI00200B6885|nr:hypothetical protein [Leuconostoc citreum]MCK8605657.1 hypothetical protein [Leuconostoc citreum]